jgi:uncharacterized protein
MLRNKLPGFEFKWADKKAKIPVEFLNSYPNSTFETITPENYLEWITLSAI